MKSILKSKLTRIAHVDKFAIGVSEEGKKGRSKGLNALIVLAIEIF
jgi:hypothetical protein